MRSALHMTLGGFASVLVTAPCVATTWVVDDNGGPGVDFVDIQLAVDAAVDGDVIEVHDGAYPGFTIDGESLVVRGLGADVRASVVVVQNIDASRRVEIDRIRMIDMTGSSQALGLLQNAGSVRLIDCLIQGFSTGIYVCTPPYPQAAVQADQSADVTLLRCDVSGGEAFYAYDCAREGAPGIVASQSGLTVLDTTVAGGDGSFFEFGKGPDGGDAAILGAGTSVLAHRSAFQGGSGAPAGCSPSCGIFPCVGSPCPDGIDGDGIVVDASASVTWKDTTFSSVVGAGSVIEVAMAPYCLGTYEECPCGNNGASVAGCEHSFGSGGARLAGVGNASVAADTVTLQVTGLNPNASPTALFFQGTTGSEGNPLNDGLLCAGGTILRMKGKLASNGTVSFGFGQVGDPAVSSAGNVPPAGATRFYQVWYRNQAASFCTPLRYNMSNGVEIAWAP